LHDLSKKENLWSINVVPKFKEQLSKVGRSDPDGKRYKVDISITQGNKKPTKDIDNYGKRIIDSITYTKQMWYDDEQIDELLIKREFDEKSQNSKVDIEIEDISN